MAAFLDTRVPRHHCGFLAQWAASMHQSPRHN